jgi:hypothetical protein
MSPRHTADALRTELRQLDATLQMGMLHLQEWLPEHPSTELQRSADLTTHLLHKLRAGWNESGLWGPSAIGEGALAEAEAVQDALRARLKGIERVARLSAGPLSADEQATLDRFCASLTEG